MKKSFLIMCLIGLSLLASHAFAGKPADADNDGYTTTSDCNDNDATIYPGASELCDNKDNNCNGSIDEGCPPPSGPHSGLSWTGYTMCKECHLAKYNEVVVSTHYQWSGSAAGMVNGAASQGKIAGTTPSSSAINAYCINILGNWNGCGSCHIGLGAVPTASNIDNIDCLICHNKDYKRVKVSGIFQPAAGIDMNVIVRTLHKPVRANCTQCHARGGGGDNFKRGDMSIAHANTNDTSFDRHMANTGANLVCQSCHSFMNHRVAGRGSDIRPTDSAVSIGCSTAACHPTKTSATGHATVDVNKHTARVACQSCHIPTYARDASDTAATEATEMHRDWTVPEWNATANRWEPLPTKANNQKPLYLHWNKTSWGNNLKDPAVIDPITGKYQLSRPLGGVNDTASKLFPFKYKTAKQAYAPGLNMMIAIDTANYWTTGNPDSAVKAGLVNMGFSSTEPYSWVTTDEYQLITHEVPPAAQALGCSACHPNASATQVNLLNAGYGLKAATSVVCAQCHSVKKAPAYQRMHNNHVYNRGFDCSWCHSFSRPEKGLTMP